ncbi:MAG: mechanosensitive ion channel family protein [Gallionella sp.]|jgi:CRP-like cAMP-binding protein/small-conductance mechanosensitive channel
MNSDEIMGFWQTAIAYFWREEAFFMLTSSLVLSFFLIYFLKHDRKSVINTLIFFFACQVLAFFSGLVYAMQFTSTAALFHETAIIGSGIAVIRMCGLLAFRIVLPLIRLQPPRITEDIFVIIAYLGWCLVRLRYAGLDLGSIIATSAMITAVVAFSMQDTLGNILGGLALQLDNSIEIGDWIKVEDVVGRVVDIRWRSTLVETRNWETVVFPNSQLMKNKFLVLGRRSGQPSQLRRWVWFNVSLSTAPRQVVRAVEETILLADISNVAKQPPPSCVLMEIDKGVARYALRYWLTDLTVDDPTDAAVRWHVYTSLERAGIPLVVEMQNVHYVKENEKYEVVVHQRESQQRVKTLKRVELFAQMTDDELTALAERLKYAQFAKGNIISRQGAIAHWLYIIINGEAEVYLETPNGERRSVNLLSKGSFFGEMGMMTGEPRSASVIANTDVECYRLDKEAFAGIMQARPGLAEEMTHILVERRVQLDSVLHHLDEQTRRQEKSSQHNELLETVKRFFGL